MSNEIAVYQPQSHQLTSVFANTENFEFAQRVAKALSQAGLVPDIYKNNIPNAMIALEMANRIGASPLMVMQNMNVIEGKPSWSSQFIISAINSCGRFTPLKFKIEDLGQKKVEYETWTGPKGDRKRESKTITIDDVSCIAYTTDKDSREIIEGPPVTISMAVAEGWYTKPGSKWKTMSHLMLRYRSAAFFGRLYAPEILMGMQSEDEVQDISDIRTRQTIVNPPVGTSIKDTINAEIVVVEEAPVVQKEEPFIAPPTIAQDIEDDELL